MSFGTANSPRVARPPAGTWAIKLADSISDETIPYGQGYDAVLARYGWKPLNSNLLPNGSLETDATDWNTTGTGDGSSAFTFLRDTSIAVHGSASAKLTSQAANVFYTNFGGLPPAGVTYTTSGGVVTSTAIVAPSAGYLGATGSLAGGGATTTTSVAIAVNAAGGLAAVVKWGAGAGYTGPTVPPTFLISNSGGTSTFPVLTANISGGAVTGVAITNAGAGLPNGTWTLSASGGGATVDAALAVTVSGGAVTGCGVVGGGGGSGYTTPPFLTLSEGGSGAKITATFSGGDLNLITVAAPGSGYAPSPATYALSGAPTTPATIIAALGQSGAVRGIFVQNAGAGYTAGTFNLAVTTYRPQSRAYQCTSLALGGTYLFSGFIRNPSTGGLGGGATAIFIQALAVSTAAVTTTIMNLAPTAGNDVWKQVTGTFTIPVGTVALYFRLGATATATGQSFWADAFQIVPVPAGVTMTAPPTYCDYCERGAVGGSTMSNVPGTTPTQRGYPQLLVPTSQIGTGVSVFVGTTVTCAESTYALRATKHTAAGVIWIECGINDLAYASALYGANAVTLATYQTGWNTVLAAIRAQFPSALIVVCGITNFHTGSWPVAPPAFARDYYDAANQLDEVVRRLCITYSCLWVPMRPYMDLGVVQAYPAIHPQPGVGQQFMANRVSDALEWGK
jgi:lysophospholipase L1-like esterase